MLDRGDAADLMDVLRHELGFSKSEKRFPRKDTCLAIYSHRVNTQRPLADTLDALFPWCAEWESQLTQLYRAYVEKKLANQALDYDDLLLYWHAMMSDERLASDDRRRVRSHPRRRIPGHERAAGRDPESACAGTATASPSSGTMHRRFIRSGRRRSTTSWAFRISTVRENGLPASVITLEDNYRSTQAGAGRGERADGRRRAAVSKGAANDERRRPSARTT